MRLVQSADAARLTGLTPHQLREWCARRAILSADVEGQGPGRHALYSWQTILALRLLATLRAEYAVEIASWAPFARAFRARLQSISFLELWDQKLWILSAQSFELINSAQRPDKGLLIALDPHLEAIALAFSFEGAPEQLPLSRAHEVPR